MLSAMTGAGIPLHNDIVRISLQYADLETVQWLLRQGAATDTLTEELFLFAIHSGRLDVLEFLYHNYNGISLDNGLLTGTAAEMGHLDVLKRLREWGCTWDHIVIQNALMNEHLSIAQWAVENGCPLTATPLPVSDDVHLRSLIVNLAGGNSLTSIH
jgi:hypothetical protein